MYNIRYYADHAMTRQLPDYDNNIPDAAIRSYLKGATRGTEVAVAESTSNTSTPTLYAYDGIVTTEPPIESKDGEWVTTPVRVWTVR